MDEKIAAVLQEYEQRAKREARMLRELPPEQLAARVDELLIPVGPQTGRFLHDLAVAAGARLLLELGTSYGYSAVWLAAAARATGGRVVSIDVVPAKQDYARAALERAGLAACVEMVIDDGQDVIGRLRGPFDLVLIDHRKDLYIAGLEAVRPKLARNAYVVADNMLVPEQNRPDAERYRAHVRGVARETILLPIGSGIEVSRFTAG